MKIKLLELFSGMGGFAKGLEEAGFEITTHYFSEVDKHAIANYHYNFKNAKYVGPVQNVRGSGIERPDIITFGSPCQDFSLAGKQTGLNGKRSVLVLEAIRLIEELRPSIFIWENVKGAFSSNGGADFWAIIAAFANIGGYRLEWQLLNSKWYVPQNRERIYLVGCLAGKCRPGVFPIGESVEGAVQGKQTNDPAVVRTFTAGGHSGGQHSGMTLVKHRSDQPFKHGDIAPTVRNSDKGEVRIVVKQLNPSLESGDKQPFQQNRIYDANGNVPALMKEKADLLIVQKPHGYFKGSETDFSPTLKTSSCEHNMFVKNSITTGIRRLTPIETERLQGFPDNFTKFGDYNGTIKEIPKTQRYKLCGNAVTVNVVKAVGQKLIKLMENENN